MTLLSSFHFYQTQNTPTEGLKAMDFISSGEGGEVGGGGQVEYMYCMYCCKSGGQGETDTPI